MSGMMLDLEQLMRVAGVAGALSGNASGAGGRQLAALMGQKEASLTLSTLGTMYGCCGLFSPCDDAPLLTLTLEEEKFLAWLGWVANNECNQFVKLLQYVGPAGTSTGAEGTGAKAACDDAAGVEFGTAELLLPDKGRLARSGPVRDLTNVGQKLCQSQPLYTKNGELITNELMWSFTMAGIAVRQDIKRMVITGNASSANQFSGLQTLVNTGYVDARSARRVTAMDSYVLNWANNLMSTSYRGGVLVNHLIAIIRQIRARAAWTSMGGIAMGDQVLMMPTFLRDGLLDVYTCWSVCPGAQYNETNLNTYEARAYRNTLNGGTYGDGQIYVDGTAVPIICYDWTALSQAAPYFIGDIYVLTRNLGSTPVLRGQYIDMNEPAAAFVAEAGIAHYRATDSGRFLTYWKTDNECVNTTVVVRPNIYLSAPWAQARIQNVSCQTLLSPISPDPTSSYYAESVLNPATCPENYLVDSLGNVR